MCLALDIRFRFNLVKISNHQQVSNSPSFFHLNNRCIRMVGIGTVAFVMIKEVRVISSRCL